MITLWIQLHKTRQQRRSSFLHPCGLVHFHRVDDSTIWILLFRPPPPHRDPTTPTCTLGPHYSYLHTGTPLLLPAHWGPFILPPAHRVPFILPLVHWYPIIPTCTPITPTYTVWSHYFHLHTGTPDFYLHTGAPSYGYLHTGTPWYSHLHAGTALYSYLHVGTPWYSYLQSYLHPQANVVS